MIENKTKLNVKKLREQQPQREAAAAAFNGTQASTNQIKQTLNDTGESPKKNIGNKNQKKDAAAPDRPKQYSLILTNANGNAINLTHKQQTSSLTTTTKTKTTIAGNVAASSNAVRDANQQFFLLPAYKDKNFLKEECEIAHSHVVSGIPDQITTKRIHIDDSIENFVDNRNNNNNNKNTNNNNNNNNSNSNNNNYNNNNSYTNNICNYSVKLANPILQNTTSTAAGINSISRTANGGLINSTNGRGIASKIENFLNRDHVTRSPRTTLNSARVESHPIKPRVHRTIPLSAVTGANIISSHSTVGDIVKSANNNGSIIQNINRPTNSNNNNKTNYIMNNNNNYNVTNTIENKSGVSKIVKNVTVFGGNNRMQQTPILSNALDRDDIKFIDSDESAPLPPIKTVKTSTAAAATSNLSKSANVAGSIALAPLSNKIQVASSQRYNGETNINSTSPVTGKPIAKVRARPKSTILVQTTATNGNLVFEKVNNYKFTNGTVPNGTITATSSTATGAAGDTKMKISKTTGVPIRNDPTRIRRSAIDSVSIKESIDKFNSYSEQKRIPLSSAVTMRSSTHSSTNSNSQNAQNRHSSDFENSNFRLPNNLGGNSSSLTRTPLRNVATNVVAPASGKFITSMQSTTPITILSRPQQQQQQQQQQHQQEQQLLANNTNSLPSKTSASNKIHEISLLRTATRGSASSLLSKDAAASENNASPLQMMGPSSTGQRTLRNRTSNAVAEAKKQLALRGLSNGDDNSRSSSLVGKSTASPTSSAYRKYVVTSTASNNASDSNKLSSGDDKFEGLCGLKNIGNTCFMNSIIQCLSHTSDLTKFLRSHNALRSSNNNTKDQQILYEFSKLIREMWSGTAHCLSPNELKRAFSIKHRMYSDCSQQDAQEFLRFFLDSLHGGLNTGVKGELLKIDDNLSDNKKAELTWEWYARIENSVIRDLFVGQLKSTLRCTICGNSSVTFDPFWDLSVPLPSSSRCKLESCLDLFIREEVLDGDEMPTCSKCKTRRKCTKSLAIQRFPKYLVIHLKRFSETRWSKLSNIVEFPTGERELNMGSYGSNPHSNMHFSLYAISNHMGSTAGGHYVALCKHPTSRKWHEFNDNIISDSVPESHLVSSSAYILFYERA